LRSLRSAAEGWEIHRMDALHETAQRFNRLC
jgi:hypothetical protein